MTKQIHEAYEIYLKSLDGLKSPAIFLTRLIWGSLFILEGYDKLSNIPSTTQFFVSLNIPYPEFMVYMSGSAELFCGIFLLLGLFTRIAAVPLIITMIVAVVTDPSSHSFLGHGSDSTEAFLSQDPLVFAYMTAIPMFFGAGKWSLDYLLRGKFFLCR